MAAMEEGKINFAFESNENREKAKNL